MEETITVLEAKREVLGDLVVETALAPLLARRAALDAETNPLTSTTMLPTLSPTSERRVVTILFCDVKGSTAMAEQYDPEEWAGIINHALEYLTEPVRRYRGTVAQGLIMARIDRLDAEALALYRQAMKAYTRVRGDDWKPIERARLERKIGEAFYRLGDFSQERAYLTRSLALLGEALRPRAESILKEIGAEFELAAARNAMENLREN